MDGNQGRKTVSQWLLEVQDRSVKTNPQIIQICVFCLFVYACLCICVSVCAHVCVQTQLSVSEQEIQDMIRQRMRKMEEIRVSLAELEVKHTSWKIP